MLVANYVILFVILISLGILYQKYLEKQSTIAAFDDYGEVKKYLLKDKSLDKSKKPILWIHNAYEKNDRNWLDFGARNSNELNKPVIYLTVQSIITKCDRSFRICLIDDNSFMNLIPGWNIDFDKISEPSKSYYREIAQLHLLHIY